MIAMTTRGGCWSLSKTSGEQAHECNFHSLPVTSLHAGCTAPPLLPPLPPLASRPPRLRDPYPLPAALQVQDQPYCVQRAPRHTLPLLHAQAGAGLPIRADPGEAAHTTGSTRARALTTPLEASAGRRRSRCHVATCTASSKLCALRADLPLNRGLAVAFLNRRAATWQPCGTAEGTTRWRHAGSWATLG